VHRRTRERKPRVGVFHNLSGIRNGWIARALPQLFRAAGLEDVTDASHAVRLRLEFADGLLDRNLAKAVAAGVLSSQELSGWWSDLEEADANGPFQRRPPRFL
jgi:hypothetical protein